MSTARRRPYCGCTLSSHRGLLRLRYRLAGRQRAVPTGLDDTAENRRKLTGLQAAVGQLVQQGRDPTPVLRAFIERERRVPTGPTVRSTYETWIEERRALADRGSIPLSRWREYEAHFRRYLLPILGDLELSELRAADVRALQHQLLTQPPPAQPKPRRGRASLGVPLSVKTVRNVILGSLAAFLRQARTDELVTRDLLAGLEWEEWEPPEADPFTADERERILAWFAARTYRAGNERRPWPAYHAYLHLLFWSGMRPSEAAGLKVGRLDLERLLVHVRESRTLGRQGRPKTRAARRTLSIFPATAALLRAIVPVPSTPDTPVFRNVEGGALNHENLYRLWYAGLQALGIRQRGLYATKDTFVTEALYRTRQAGVPLDIPWLERQTGVQYQTLKRHYGRWWPDETGAELARFAALYPALFDEGAAPRRRRRA